ncbi:hypothetical protein C8R45DRAFT_1110002 [Mycena sanguinolenta]|nr:hypothetical protein C8R45DRAFT_1110002 [Mycena sanguinolenta]
MCTAHYTRPHQRRERHLRVVRLLAFQHVVRKVGVLSAGLGVSMCYAVAIALAAAKKIAEPRCDERWHEEDDCVAVGDEGVAQQAKNVDDEEHYGFFALPCLPDVDVDGDEDEGAVAVPDPAGDGAGDWPRAWDLGTNRRSYTRVPWRLPLPPADLFLHFLCSALLPNPDTDAAHDSRCTPHRNDAPHEASMPRLRLRALVPAAESEAQTTPYLYAAIRRVKMPLAEAVVVVVQLCEMGHEERGVFFDGMGQA